MDHFDIHRRLGEQEISSILTLAKIVERSDGHKALEDHTWVDLVLGGRKGVTGFIAQNKTRTAALGYVQVAQGQGSWAIELLLHPRERHESSSVGPELLKAATHEIKSQGGGHVHMWIAKPTSYIDALAQATGFQKGRDLFQLRRELPLSSKEEESRSGLRHFVVGQDEERWLAVNNRAFSWHPEQGGWTLATLISRESEPWFDPQGFFLYEVDGELASFCWTKIHADDDPPLGEIYVIGTDPEFGGRGLGEYMCKVGLQYLSRMGMPLGMLYVDSSNYQALRLYKKLGFFEDHLDRAYTADI